MLRGWWQHPIKKKHFSLNNIMTTKDQIEISMIYSENVDKLNRIAGGGTEDRPTALTSDNPEHRSYYGSLLGDFAHKLTIIDANLESMVNPERLNVEKVSALLDALYREFEPIRRNSAKSVVKDFYKIDWFPSRSTN